MGMGGSSGSIGPIRNQVGSMPREWFLYHTQFPALKQKLRQASIKAAKILFPISFPQALYDPIFLVCNPTKPSFNLVLIKLV